ncbi:hypothetical protein ABZW30_46875 [Kitasatospora sp. NPDC004669]|uniref:hypothetical protein n=1 Tax=Kitasatospora sp. NPDC004669 TaxID=3154555 RepID=UPI0033A70A34
MTPETPATAESCDHRMRRLVRIESPLIAPHTRVEITSYGVLHQDPPLGDALTLDLTIALFSLRFETVSANG